MTKVIPRYCPRCGAPIVTSSGTCATCGLALESILSRGQYKSPEQVNHDQEYLPEIDQQFIQDEPGVQQVGSDLQGPDDDRGGDRPHRPPLGRHRAQHRELSGRRSQGAHCFVEAGGEAIAARRNVQLLQLCEIGLPWGPSRRPPGPPGQALPENSRLTG